MHKVMMDMSLNSAVDLPAAALVPEAMPLFTTTTNILNHPEFVI